MSVHSLLRHRFLHQSKPPLVLTDDTTFSALLKTARDVLQLSDSQFAYLISERFNVSTKAVYYWLTGSAVPNINVASKVIQHLRELIKNQRET